MAITSNICAEFYEKGFVQLRSVVDVRECQKLILRMHELTERACPNDRTQVFHAGENEHSKDDFFLRSANKIAFFFDKNSHGSIRRRKSNFYALNKVGHALHSRCPVFKKFSHRDDFYQLVRTLGHKKPMLIQSMFIFKQANFGDEVPPHQDASFLYTEPVSVIGLWFALEDADENNGCLWVLEGGHRGNLKNRFLRGPDKLVFDFPERVSWPKELFRPLPARAGDAIILHGLLPHYSERNHSAKTRLAYTTHFIDRTCHYPKTNWLNY
ncbi:MAG TPA: phytanoyl-CoA dioxygenase family protein [Myxococcota bacterium]|nr:phytanoyl-CoA dioxygenase family protein [Myxococcota bacterium]